ncbi:MAG: Hpt domain-containing protein [Defluviitaleaceae bacterium]|nr:Hpt domain-containing protein [Defluviitaleaceae bacterium]
MSLIIEGIDVDKGLSQMRGKLDRYMKILAIFSGEGRKKILEIESALSARDIVLYTTLVDAVKGAASGVGALKLSERAKELEDAGHRKDQPYILEHTDTLLREYGIILQNIDDALAQARTGERVDVDPKELAATLLALKQALQNDDYGAVNAAVRNLRDHTQAADIGPYVDDIIRNKRQGRLEEALTAVEVCLEKLGYS